MFMHTNVLHCAGIESAISCVVGEYSDHYAKSAVNIKQSLVWCPGQNKRIAPLSSSMDVVTGD
jgi:hypothetical protein